MIKPKIALAPVLRAGLGMTDALLNLFPCVAPVPLHSDFPPDPYADTGDLDQGCAGVPPRHLQGEGDPAAR